MAVGRESGAASVLWHCIVKVALEMWWKMRRRSIAGELTINIKWKVERGRQGHASSVLSNDDKINAIAGHGQSRLSRHGTQPVQGECRVLSTILNEMGRANGAAE